MRQRQNEVFRRRERERIIVKARKRENKNNLLPVYVIDRYYRLVALESYNNRNPPEIG